MNEEINILEHQLADIEHLEIGLLQVMSDQPEQVADKQINKRTADMKRRLLQRIAALKIVKNH